MTEDLKYWLFRNNLSMRAFSKMIDYSIPHLSWCLSGKYKMGRKLAKAIETATNGEIKATDLLKENAIKYEKFKQGLGDSPEE